MDIRCPKCAIEYELDDARVPADGATVKCASCEYVFLARRVPVAEEVGVTQAVVVPSREWKVRRPNGDSLTCESLAVLQGWIQNGTVTREDEVSLAGESWKPLGMVPELTRFFADDVHEEAPTEAISLQPLHGGLREARLERVVRSGRGKWIALILGGIALGAGAGWYIVFSKPHVEPAPSGVQP